MKKPHFGIRTDKVITVIQMADKKFSKDLHGSQTIHFNDIAHVSVITKIL